MKIPQFDSLKVGDEIPALTTTPVTRHTLALYCGASGDHNPIHGGYVFEQRCWNRKAYLKALNSAGIEDFTFHDLRHCALNNLRLAGNDRYVIKKASGHKTDSAFQRYLLVTEDEMGGMKWLDQKKNSGTIDT